MIILDTNVISELMKDDAHAGILDWYALQSANELWLTSITLAELLVGINRLPAGQRRRNLVDSLTQILDTGFRDRLLPFDHLAALEYGNIVPQRLSAGRQFSILDIQIAAIAEVHGATLATRNTKDFLDTGIALINPWDEFPATTGA